MLTQLINKTDKTKFHPSVFINLFFLLIVCALLIKLSLQLFGTHNTSPPNTAPGVEQTITESHLKKGIQEKHIASLHLFGMPSREAEIDSVQVTPEPVSAPETPLNLTLKGIAAERIKLRSRVIIQNNNTNQEEFFAIRDNVFDLATVEDIYHDRVLLVRNGQFETLLLQKESLSNEIIQTGHMDDAHKIDITEFLNSAIIQYDRTLTYPVTLDAVYRKGLLIGYRTTVQQHDKNGVIRDLGLVDGDLITAFNGVSFASAQTTNLSSAISNEMTSGEIEIMRDNDSHTLYLEIDSYQPELDEYSTEEEMQSISASEYNPEVDYD